MGPGKRMTRGLALSASESRRLRLWREKPLFASVRVSHSGAGMEEEENELLCHATMATCSK
jgi:hypothetical protein